MLRSSPESLAAFRQVFFDACALFRPPEKLSVAEWADKYLFLSPEGSARPGKYYTSTAEYQREPMECLSPDSGYDEVVQCWSSQTGKTQNALNLVGYHTHHDPAPILFLEPDENLAKAIAQDRINPMIRDTPVLAPLFGKGKGQGNDTLHKSFPGGQIDVGWASSPTGMASRPKRVLVTDEEDAYVLAANKEGNPVQIAKARLATFSELGIAKHFRVSSPRLKRTSLIWSAFLDTDQRYFYVACPHCGHMQTLRWEQLWWPGKDGDGPPDSQACVYLCEQNGCRIEHREKFRMVRQGKWIAHNPGGGNGRKAGFHLNALYSTIGFSWSKLVDAFLECKGLPGNLQVFTNTLLGLPWDEQAEGVEVGAVESRAETYAAQAPAWVLMVTCGADVQKNRIEGTKWGWGFNEQAGPLEHRVFYGDPEKEPEVWDRFEAWRSEQVVHESGIFLPTRCTFVDSGDGNRTQAVYAYTRRHRRDSVFACKGSSQPGAPLVSRAKPVGQQRTLLVSVGTSSAKDTIYARLQIEDRKRAGYVHFPNHPSSGVDGDFFKHLTAEKLVTRQTRNGEVSKWENPNKRNEALDCAVYAYAAKEFVRASMRQLATTLAARAAKLNEAEKTERLEQWAGQTESAPSRSPASSPASRSPAPRPNPQGSRPKKPKKRLMRPGSSWIRG